MPQKGKMIAVYPSLRDYEQIQKEAKEKRWKLGPTVLNIVRMYFAGPSLTRTAQALVDVFGEVTEEQVKAVHTKLQR